MPNIKGRYTSVRRFQVKFIMQHKANGKSTEEIAKILGLSKRTVETIMSDALKWHDAENASHLMAIYFRNNLIN